MMVLNQDALSHSDKLEPDINHEKTLRQLEEAWEYAVAHFSGNINRDFVIDVAQKVHATNYSYRQETARVKGIRGTIDVVTNPAKIEREMDKLFDYLLTSTSHPALKAAELNLYFLLIHPFADGNGRTARLLHNLYLHNYKLPPVMIRHTERVTYLSHIEDARIGFKNRSGQENMFENRSFGEIRFFEYTIDKIKESAERLSKKIENHHKYEISVDIRGPQKLIFGVTRTFKELLHARALSGQVSQKEGKITIIAPITEECVMGTMERYARKSPSTIKNYDVQKLF
jgi:Fic family protein